jgi:large subunit ribosomal protein L6
MSRIGDKPIGVPAGVTVKVEDRRVSAKGPQGELSVEIPERLSVALEDDRVVVGRPDDTRESKRMHGLVRSLVANMVEGVEKGFSRQLEIEGVGFRASVQGQTVSLALGFASPKEYKAPDGVTVTEQGGTKITVSGPDKQKVGEAAARIRAFSPAEPYKGKGLRYAGERVRRKVGKTVA